MRYIDYQLRGPGAEECAEADGYSRGERDPAMIRFDDRLAKAVTGERWTTTPNRLIPVRQDL